jgi:hypothetical protein
MRYVDALTTSRTTEQARARREFAHECDTMRALPPHRNVLAVLAVCEEPPAIVTEHCTGERVLCTLTHAQSSPQRARWTRSCSDTRPAGGRCS